MVRPPRFFLLPFTQFTLYRHGSSDSGLPERKERFPQVSQRQIVQHYCLLHQQKYHRAALCIHISFDTAAHHILDDRFGTFCWAIFHILHDPLPAVLQRNVTRPILG
jgi:hypothetical protein